MSLLIVIYRVLRTRQPYIELGVDYFDTLSATRIERHHVRGADVGWRNAG